jgi:hypothetical protein
MKDWTLCSCECLVTWLFWENSENAFSPKMKKNFKLFGLFWIGHEFAKIVKIKRSQKFHGLQYIWRVWFQNAINAKSKISELATPLCCTNKVLWVTKLLKPSWFYEPKSNNFLMHFPVNFKLWQHFSRIHKNGFIHVAFWNQTLHLFDLLIFSKVVSFFKWWSGQKLNTTHSRMSCVRECSLIMPRIWPISHQEW